MIFYLGIQFLVEFSNVANEFSDDPTSEYSLLY